MQSTSVLILSFNASGTQHTGCQIGPQLVGMPCFTTEVQPCGPNGGAKMSWKLVKSSKSWSLSTDDRSGVAMLLNIGTMIYFW